MLPDHGADEPPGWWRRSKCERGANENALSQHSRQDCSLLTFSKDPQVLVTPARTQTRAQGTVNNKADRRGGA